MKKIALSGQMRVIPMECPESDLELRYNLDQCQARIAELEVENKWLLEYYHAVHSGAVNYSAGNIDRVTAAEAGVKTYVLPPPNVKVSDRADTAHSTAERTQ